MKSTFRWSGRISKIAMVITTSSIASGKNQIIPRILPRDTFLIWQAVVDEFRTFMLEGDLWLMQKKLDKLGIPKPVEVP